MESFGKIMEVIGKMEMSMATAIQGDDKDLLPIVFKKTKSSIEIKVDETLREKEYSTMEEVLTKLKESNGTELNIAINLDEFDRKVNPILSNMFISKHPVTEFAKAMTELLKGYGEIFKMDPDFPLIQSFGTVPVEELRDVIVEMAKNRLPIDLDIYIPMHIYVGGLFPEGFKVGFAITDATNKIIGDVLSFEIFEKGMSFKHYPFEQSKTDLVGVADEIREKLGMNLVSVVSTNIFTMLSTFAPMIMSIGGSGEQKGGVSLDALSGILPQISAFNGVGFAFSPNILEIIGSLPLSSLGKVQISPEGLESVLKMAGDLRGPSILLSDDKEIISAIYIDLQNREIRKLDTSLAKDGISIAEAFKKMDIKDAAEHTNKIVSELVGKSCVTSVITESGLRKTLKPIGEAMFMKFDEGIETVLNAIKESFNNGWIIVAPFIGPLKILLNLPTERILEIIKQYTS